MNELIANYEVSRLGRLLPSYILLPNREVCHLSRSFSPHHCPRRSRNRLGDTFTSSSSTCERDWTVAGKDRGQGACITPSEDVLLRGGAFCCIRLVTR